MLADKEIGISITGTECTRGMMVGDEGESARSHVILGLLVLVNNILSVVRIHWKVLALE